MKERVEGYEVPIHRALTVKILIAGVPREIAILNGTFAAIFLLYLHTYYALPFNFLLHVVSIYATKKDPQWFDCFRRYVNRKNYYST